MFSQELGVGVKTQVEAKVSAPGRDFGVVVRGVIMQR